MAGETGAALVPIEQRTVEFHGDELVVVLVETEAGRVAYVPIRPLCEAIGLAWSPQRRRIERDSTLSEEAMIVTVTVTKSGGVKRGNPNMLALPVEFLNGWLFGVNPDRVRPELRETVIRYRRECHRVLAQAFGPAVVTAFGPDEDTAAELVKVREFGLAIARLADEQLRLGSRVSVVEGRLDAARQWALDVTGRLKKIEATLPPGGRVSDQQAGAISAAVLDLAGLLKAEGGPDAPNAYQTVYSALHRRFGVSSYQHVPAERFADVMAFLDDWRRRAGGSP